MRGGLIAVLSLVACAGEKHDAPPPAVAMPPMRAVSCDATHDAVGTACVPRFDTCGEGEIALIGSGCRPVGVPKDGCAPGFAHDGKGACEPILPKSCDKGLFARPGESTCHAVDDCGSDRYPTVTGAVFVDAAYAGTSDGTVDRPYRTIAAALAVPSASAITIAAGRYEEDVIVDRAVRIVGVCSAKVEIVGAATGLDSAAITLRANATLEHLSITGEGSRVFVAPSPRFVSQISACTTRWASAFGFVAARRASRSPTASRVLQRARPQRGACRGDHSRGSGDRARLVERRIRQRVRL